MLFGMVTCGRGYALWYVALSSTVAAPAQLSVPVIAMAGGAPMLGEVLTLRFAVSSGPVLGGIALGMLAPTWRDRAG